jgi:hypothetical protein
MINIVAKLNELGLKVDHLKDNGKWTRVATHDKPKKRNGSYKVLDKICCWKNWATDESDWFFLEDSKPLTPAEKAEYIAKRAAADKLHKKHEIEDYSNRLTIVDKAYSAINKKADKHVYLNRKQGLMQPDFKIDFQGRLVIPMYSVINQLLGYQYIDDNGNKLFKTGTISKGAFYALKPIDCELKDLDLIFLAEGYCTASSIYQALNEEYDSINYGVLACFSAGNVEKVEDVIYSKIGRKRIIAIKDQDKAGINVKTKGFTVGFNQGHDANDIHCDFGLERLTDILIAKIRQMTVKENKHFLEQVA